MEYLVSPSNLLVLVSSQGPVILQSTLKPALSILNHIPSLSPHLPPLPPKKPNPSQYQSASQQVTPKPFSIPYFVSVNPVTLDRHFDPLHGPQHELVVVDHSL